MADVLANASDIDKLYEYGERLNESKDKSKNVKDYEGIIAAAKGSSKAKQLAAQLIPRFFKFFPTLNLQAVEAHFDLCEEEELGIRVQAIRGLPLLCKDTPEYVPKIVDVLGQLLTAEENVERDAVNKALMSLVRQDTKASLTALFKHIGGTDEPISDENIREQVLSFIRDKIFPLKSELLKPQEQMERHITDLVKKSLHDVTGAEFKMFVDFLTTLSLFGENAPLERVQELTEIIEEQADLHVEFNVSDGNHIDRLMSCLTMALPFFKRGASNSKFLNYLNRNILPVADKFPEERKRDLLMNLAESSRYTSPQDSRQLLPSVVPLLKKSMLITRTTREELNYVHVECLLYTFHHLAAKTPNATNSLCGYKIVTGQPSDRLGEDFSDIYKDFNERLTSTENLAKVGKRKLNQMMSDLDRELSSAKTEEDKASIRIKKQTTVAGLRRCDNILTMALPLRSKSPSFIGDDKVTLSWIEARKASRASGKRGANAANDSNKRGRGEGGVQIHIVNQTLRAANRGGGGGGGRGRGGGGRGRGMSDEKSQFARRALDGLIQGGGSRGRQGRRGRGRGWGYQ